VGQLEQLSTVEQVPSPQVTQGPQSVEQVLQFSELEQAPSPQVTQGPQSCAQVLQFSGLEQAPSPQTGPLVPQVPQPIDSTSETHTLSQTTWQQ
jgi:hypothetical protein